MSDLKTNPYSGVEYNCYCDYTYVCSPCETIREIRAEERHREKTQEWIIDSIEKIAEALKVQLSQKPTKPEWM